MATPADIAKQFREIYLDGKWVIGTNLKAELENTTWQDANKTVGKHNSIAALTFHLNYYLAGVQKVLDGGSLDIRDTYSFDMEVLDSHEKWNDLRNSIITNARNFASSIESIPPKSLKDNFVDPKYGTLERNLQVIIEHGYYHFGQIVMIRKILQSQDTVT